MLGDIDHPHIIHFHKLYEDKGSYYAVFEKCGGGQLFERIKAMKSFSEEDAATICKQMLMALKYLHAQNIVHRDVKGENVLFKTTQFQSSLKIIDLGIAVRLQPGETLQEPCGTLHYLAPELLQGSYGKEVDIWALGVLMYLMLYGRYPFQGSTREGILQEIETYKIDWSLQEVEHSPSTIEFLSRLMDRDPRRRLSASSALAHPFITRQPTTGAASPRSAALLSNSTIPRRLIEVAQMQEAADKDQKIGELDRARNSVFGAAVRKQQTALKKQRSSVVKGSARTSISLQNANSPS
eukprot:GHVT01099698.1.p1 GENE.GHVT01099698.1~~GHVT01099698.1.p1  ORF type:complete len:296 (-),score=57.64 GHVT01099698.1:677-1564(-)